MMKTKAGLLEAFLASQGPVGIYVHLPFCKQRCYYCDFLSATDYSQEDRYIAYLLKEIDLYHDKYGPLDIDSIYLGGGTPSSLDPGNIIKILDRLGEKNTIFPGSEISIELNPESVDRTRLRPYKQAGINRISIGCQSFDDRLLARIGRIHSSQDSLRAYELARDQGFDNINLDLIFALPGQDKEAFASDLDKLLALNPDHISTYSLILEEGTLLADQASQGRLNLASDEVDRAYYHYLIDRLENKGYVHYEISNFARKGQESRHNFKYWNLDYYIGLGLGSASFFDGARYNNYSDFPRYYQALDEQDLPIETRETMNYEDLKVDYILMKLRLTQGIDRAQYRKIFARDFYQEYQDLIDSFVKNGRMEVDFDRVAFTPDGFDVSNLFYVEII